jgi:hypothetical protein
MPRFRCPYSISARCTATSISPAMACPSSRRGPERLRPRSSRDFIFVGDIVAGLIVCALRGEPGEAYNLASGVETSILDLANLINELTGNPTPIAFAPARDWDRSGRRFGAPDKAHDHLGFVAATTLRDGLADTIAWTRTNRNRASAPACSSMRVSSQDCMRHWVTSVTERSGRHVVAIVQNAARIQFAVGPS